MALIKLFISIMLLGTACQSQPTVGDGAAFSVTAAADTTGFKRLILPREVDTPGKALLNPKYLLTLVPAADKCFYYFGDLEFREQIKQAGYENVREIIKSFKKPIGDSIVVFIKPTENVGYKNIVNILDEMAIGNINKYAMLDLTEKEEKLLGMRGFMTLKDTVAYEPPPSLAPVADLRFFLQDNGELLYAAGNDTARSKIYPPSAKNICLAMDKAAGALSKKVTELTVTVQGNKDAPYAQFKELINALKQKDVLNFKMIPN